MSIRSTPTPWQGTQATFVPGNPVSRQSLHPVPTRQQPRLGCSLLNLPGGGPTRPEEGVALGQAKEPSLEVEEGGEGVSLGPTSALYLIKS